jgi:hypothetical protein
MQGRSSKLGCQRVKRRMSMHKSVLEGFGRLENKMVLLRLRVRWNDHKKTMGYLAFIQFLKDLCILCCGWVCCNWPGRL